MKLLLRTESIEDVISVMDLFWLVFIRIVFGWEVSDKTFVTSDVLNVVFISTCGFSQELWNAVSTNPHNKRVFHELLKRHTFVLVGH